MRQPPPPRRSLLTLNRAWDILAILAVLFVLYRIFVAPRIFAAPLVPAPHVRYASLAGKPFVLTQHRGHVVFLDFWASWCEPCKLSLPLVERFARAHPQAVVIPVDVGEPRAVAQAYARRHDLRDVALDPDALSKGFFQIEGFPTIVVIDPRGRLRATWQGFNPAVGLNMAHAVSALR